MITKVPGNITLSPFKRTSLKYIHEVHEVKEILKLNLINNGSTAKCKYCGCIGRSLEYINKDSFEFWSKLMILIKLYRQHAGNKIYKLNSNHTN